MTGTSGLVSWLDRLLVAKRAPGPSGRVRFGDLELPLRVVAADLVTGTTRIFGGPGDAGMPVADAVAASACYPGVFAPVALDEGLFVDGGLVSNLPAWVFDAERRGDPGFVPTFGIRFVDGGVDAVGGRRGPSDFLRFLRRLMDTAVSGAFQLESRAIDDFYAVDLAVDVPALSFTGLRARASAMIERGRQDVLRFFETTVGPQDPERIRRVLRVVAVIMRRRLGLDGSVRAYVLMRVPAGARARVFYSAGMERDADDRMVLEMGDPGPASPLLRREPVLVRYRALTEAPGGPHAKYERALRPESVVSAYSIPVFDDPGQWLISDPAGRDEPYATLVLDAEDDMRAAVLDQTVEDLLAGVAQLVGEYVRDRRGPRLPRAASPAEDPGSGWHVISEGGGCLVSDRKLRDPLRPARHSRPRRRDRVRARGLAKRNGFSIALTARAGDFRSPRKTDRERSQTPEASRSCYIAACRAAVSSPCLADAVMQGLCRIAFEPGPPSQIRFARRIHASGKRSSAISA